MDDLVTQPITGKCLCGAVEFQLSAVEICAHCHCQYCRLSSGAAFVTWIVVPLAAFMILAGEDQIQWYRSSAQSQRGFCRSCGSAMLFKSSLCPGEIHVTRANIQGELNLPPKYHCFIDQKAEWITVNDGVACLSSDSSELAPYRQVERLDR